MRIILEGCDGTGKTETAKLLSDFFKMPVVKMNAPKTDDTCSEIVNTFSPSNFKGYIGDNIILDRCWLSETIYGPLKGRKSFTKNQLDFLNSKTRNDIVIIHHLDINKIKEIFATRGEDYITPEEAEIVNRGYFNLFLQNACRGNWFLYDFTINSKEELINFINFNLDVPIGAKLS